MDKPKQQAKVKINVAEFTVSDYRKPLDQFGNGGYTYEGKQLFVRYDSGILEKEAKGSLFLARRQAEPRGPNVVRLAPDLCGSFAIWPPNGDKDDNLLEVCKNEILRPQFVFLALNWSNKIRIVGNRNALLSPVAYFAGMPRWNTFHNIAKDAPRRIQSRLEEFFESQEDKNPFRGAYMTDFVKGYIAQDSQSVYKFLKTGKMDGTDDNPFIVFAEILRRELDALDKTFGNPGIRKYLIVFGPTIYNNLQILANRKCGKSLDELFPDRKIVYTDKFYSNVFHATRPQHLEMMRQIHINPRSETVDIRSIKTVPVGLK